MRFIKAHEAAPAALLVLLGAASAQSPGATPRVVGSVVSAEPLAHGLHVRTSNGFEEQIDALREDVLRVRIWREGHPAEDASWAVLPEARTHTADVHPISGDAFVGFGTAVVRVEIARADGRLAVLDAGGHILQQDAASPVYTGNAFQIRKAMPSDEHYFGLGDKTGPSDRRNHAYTMWNTDSYRFQESTDPLYKDIPFFLSFRAGTAMGVLLDNTWRSSFDFGKESDSFYSFGAVNGPCDYYLLAGPSPRQVVEAYGWLTGKPPLPPRWMLGFQQSRYTYTPQSRLLEVAERLRADRIPSDALYLDIDFQDRNRPFTVDTRQFPDLPGTLARLRAMHFHTVAITDLHIAAARDPGYLPYDQGMAEDRFLHRPDGSVYVGSVWPGPSVFPEFTQSASRAWWGTLYRPLLKMGFEGFWNDMNETSIFDSPTGTIPVEVQDRIDEPGFAKRTATQAEIHNIFGMQNSRATYEGLLRQQPDERPFVLTRATYAGGQRYASTWTGDDSSTWNHLRMTTPMLKSLGLGGFSFAGADVGGFAGSETPELLTRWIELGAFQPIDRDHAEKGTADQEPWVGGVEQESIRRRFLEERYRLMPYLYTLAEETARTGLPMLRPLFLDYPQATRDGHAMDLDPGIDAEFLLGHDLLIAPSPYPEAPDAYTVEFPSDRWYDFWSGAAVEHAPQSHRRPDAATPPPAMDSVPLYTTVKPSLETLPVYVRGGAILPMAPLTQSTDETPQGPLTLRVYTGDDCRGEMYTDDGRSFSYRHGAFLRVRFQCSVTESGMKLDISKHEGSYPAWWRQIRVEIYGWRGVKGTVKAYGADTSVRFAGNALSFTVPDNGNGLSLAVQ